MATKYQVQCNVVPGTAEYFRDFVPAATEDSVDFCFDQAVVIEDVIVSGSNTTYSGSLQILYPESKAEGTITTSVTEAFSLNEKTTPREAKLWYPLPAKTIVRFTISTVGSGSLQVCMIVRG